MKKKTVLLVTTNEAHRKLYTRGLARYFEVEFNPKSAGGSGKVDALVYDIPETRASFDIKWLKSLDLPVVVLSPEDGLPLPSSPKRCFLTYPVKMDQILDALKRLGVLPRTT
jgi:hypothetical protein